MYNQLNMYLWPMYLYKTFTFISSISTSPLLYVSISPYMYIITSLSPCVCAWSANKTSRVEKKIRDARPSERIWRRPGKRFHSGLRRRFRGGFQQRFGSYLWLYSLGFEALTDLTPTTLSCYLPLAWPKAKLWGSD